MKITLLKMFRKRFEIFSFGEQSFALADHKIKRVYYFNTWKGCLMKGVSDIVSYYEYYRFHTTRRKRIYRSLLIKRP